MEGSSLAIEMLENLITFLAKCAVPAFHVVSVQFREGMNVNKNLQKI